MKVTRVSMLNKSANRDYWNRGDRSLRKFYDTQGKYMQRKSPVWLQPLSFFKLRNNTQKGTRVVTGQAIKPQVDRRICIGQLFERINHISSFFMHNN